MASRSIITRIAASSSRSGCIDRDEYFEGSTRQHIQFSPAYFCSRKVNPEQLFIFFERTFITLLTFMNNRDLEEDLYPHFHRLFGMLVKHVDAVAYSGNSKSGGSNAPNPELTGKLFETLSYLLK